jgi:hypothetical protein
MLNFFNLDEKTNQKIMNTLLEIKKDITELKKEVSEIHKSVNNSREKNKEAEESYLNVRILIYFIFLYINKN